MGDACFERTIRPKIGPQPGPNPRTIASRSDVLPRELTDYISYIQVNTL